MKVRIGCTCCGVVMFYDYLSYPPDMSDSDCRAVSILERDLNAQTKEGETPDLSLYICPYCLEENYTGGDERDDDPLWDFSPEQKQGG